MLAARLHEPRTPLRIEEVPTPEPGPGEALVAVRACGVCGSDVHFWLGEAAVPRLPLTLGHEPAGVVAELGPGVEGWREGDRVTVLAGYPCNRCPACLRSDFTACVQGQILGFTTDGGLAQYLKVPAVCLVPLPDSLPFEQGAIVVDAVATPFHALTERGRLQAGETVAIFGIGGLGTHAVQIARLCGASLVISVDMDEVSLARAARLGADVTIDARREDPVQRIKALTGGVDLAVELIGLPQTVGQAVQSLRRGGRAVVVGVGPEPMTLPPVGLFTYSEWQLMGSFGSTRAEVEKVLDLIERGRLDLSESISSTLPLADAHRALEMLHSRQGSPVRIVVEPPAAG